MSDDSNDLPLNADSALPSEPASKGRVDLRLIGLIFLLPLVLMFVTSVVCIAVVLARH